MVRVRKGKGYASSILVLAWNGSRQLRRLRMLLSVTGSERSSRGDAAGNDAEVSINEQHLDTAGVLGVSLSALLRTRLVPRRIYGTADQQLPGKESGK